MNKALENTSDDNVHTDHALPVFRMATVPSDPSLET